MKCLVFSMAVFAAVSANAAGVPCSIHPKKGLADSELPALTKVTQAAAEATALKSVKIPPATVASGELEAEGGCLIYSFDIKVPGKKSVIEVTVDAGTGKVLSTKHEGPKAQAAESAADAAAVKKP
jgi:uncharacterized membrane protein YkoI